MVVLLQDSTDPISKYQDPNPETTSMNQPNAHGKAIFNTFNIIKVGALYTMLSILRKARLKDKELRILML